MKYTIMSILLAINILPVEGQSFYSDKQFDDKINRLVVTNPTVATIQIMAYLIDNKIVEINHLQIVGVYYEKESYDYNLSVEYLKSNKLEYIKLHKLKGELTIENIYQKNELSNEFKVIFDNSSGIIFMGGPDIPPATYQQKTNLHTTITDPNRHLFEISFLFHLLGGSQDSTFKPFIKSKPDFIILGICLGMQTMNVANGGTLIQDIPTELYSIENVEDILNTDEDMQHRNYNKLLSTDEDISYGWLHKIRFIESGIFVEKMNIAPNNEPRVYSSHHQSLHKIGKDYIPAAYSIDGKIIEAMQHREFQNVYAFQFHPEKIGLFNENIKIRYQADAKQQEPYAIRLEKNGIVFHYAIWKYFGSLFNEK